MARLRDQVRRSESQHAEAKNLGLDCRRDLSAVVAAMATEGRHHRHDGLQTGAVHAARMAVLRQAIFGGGGA